MFDESSVKNSDLEYNTTEQACGTWIDGKTIFRTVIESTAPKDSGDGIILADVSHLAIERIIRLYGNLIDKSGACRVPFPITYTLHDNTGNPYINAAVNPWVDKNNGTLRMNFINNGGSYSNCKMYIVLEYIK